MVGTATDPSGQRRVSDRRAPVPLESEGPEPQAVPHALTVTLGRLALQPDRAPVARRRWVPQRGLDAMLLRRASQQPEDWGAG